MLLIDYLTVFLRIVNLLNKASESVIWARMAWAGLHTYFIAGLLSQHVTQLAEFFVGYFAFFVREIVFNYDFWN